MKDRVVDWWLSERTGVGAYQRLAGREGLDKDRDGSQASQAKTRTSASSTIHHGNLNVNYGHDDLAWFFR